jgi:hypothetical protein
LVRKERGPAGVNGCRILRHRRRLPSMQCMHSVLILTSADATAHLTQDQEDDADYQQDNADRYQNADTQDPAQDQQDETKNVRLRPLAGAVLGGAASRDGCCRRRHAPCGWRPIAVVSIAASALFIVFLILPWGNATFLLAIVTLFGWIAALAARLATRHP